MNRSLADRIARIRREILERTYTVGNRKERWDCVLRHLGDVDRSLYQEIEPHVEVRTRSTYLSRSGRGTAQVPGFVLVEFIPHSMVMPAVGNVDGFRYPLLGYFLSRDEWFNVLGYSSEDRVAHTLKYGHGD